MRCVFVSDLHGDEEKYGLLFEAVKDDTPDAVFIGGDIFSGATRVGEQAREFLDKHLFSPLEKTRSDLDSEMRCFVIMGNDDLKIFEPILADASKEGVIDYVNQRCVDFGDKNICGYSYVPPTPFQLKDWEKYDVSRYVDVGAVSPEQGFRTVEIPDNQKKHSTIADDLEKLGEKSDPADTIYLFHSPPYETNLDRADLDGVMIDHVPMDVHVGSIAIKRFIEESQPLLALHGHIHETVELTGEWRDKIGETPCFTGVHDGKGLAVIKFDTDDLENASREIFH
ncbi:MAG: metallophosphoesterase [Thermoplasmata archaeon]